MYINREQQATTEAKTKKVPLVTVDTLHLPLVETIDTRLHFGSDKSIFTLIQEARRLDAAGKIVYLLKTPENSDTP